jgi:hypothetical protein
MDWNAQCQPPEGLYACTKDAQKAVKNHKSPDSVPANDDADDESTNAEKGPAASNDEDNWNSKDDDSSQLFSTDEEAPHLRGPGSFPWLAIGASVALLVTGVAMLIRKRRIERGSYNESPMFVEADDESS